MGRREIEIWVTGSPIHYYDEIENVKKYLTISDYDVDLGYVKVPSDFIEKAFKEFGKLGIRYNKETEEFEKEV